jgi:hypothetical protein
VGGPNSLFKMRLAQIEPIVAKKVYFEHTKPILKFELLNKRGHAVA